MLVLTVDRVHVLHNQNNIMVFPQISVSSFLSDMPYSVPCQCSPAPLGQCPPPHTHTYMPSMLHECIFFV